MGWAADSREEAAGRIHELGCWARVHGPYEDDEQRIVDQIVEHILFHHDPKL